MKPGERVEHAALTIPEIIRLAHESFVTGLKKRRARTLLDTIRYANTPADAVGDSMKNERDACREGCSSCCSSYVSVAIPEAIAVAAYVATHDTGQKRARIVERLRANAAARKGRSWNQIPLAPCAFLVEGSCS